ncbi:Phosphoserine phosphatase (PSP) (PSPase) (O-phosphoserine phosphohydrolase) [Durusdinium trenchii]
MRRSRSCLVALTAPVALLWHLWMPEGSPLAFFFESKEDPVERTKRLLKETDAVFFDVDSTVVTTEGIDLIGKCFGIMKEISELTHKAMNGNVKFQDAMAERLQLMADHGMTKEKLEKCVKTEGVPKWSPGIKEVVQMLHKQGTDVYLVSGGFQNMIKPIALELHIPQKMIYANEILFDEQGNYAGFDRKAPTSASGGKPKVLRLMKRRKGYKKMIMIGDGATDLDARLEGPAKAFIGYGGVSVREKVKKNADWFITSFQEVLDVLPKGTDL